MADKKTQRPFGKQIGRSLLLKLNLIQGDDRVTQGNIRSSKKNF
jgi:hypothetical protein